MKADDMKMEAYGTVTNRVLPHVFNGRCNCTHPSHRGACPRERHRSNREWSLFNAFVSWFCLVCLETEGHVE